VRQPSEIAAEREPQLATSPLDDDLVLHIDIFDALPLLLS